MARTFRIDWGDGTAPETQRAGAVDLTHVYARKGTYAVTVVNEQRNVLATTKTITFPADFVIDWTTKKASALSWDNVITVQTPASVEAFTGVKFDDRLIGLSAVTKTAPGRFTIKTSSAPNIGTDKAKLTITAAGYDVVCANVTVRADQASGRCEVYGPQLKVKHVSNAGVLGVGRGTWLTVYAESGVDEVDVTWLDPNGAPYPGYDKRIKTWQESPNFGYMYGYTAVVKVPGTGQELRCKVGPDGACGS